MKQLLFVVPAVVAIAMAMLACSSTNTVLQVIPSPDAGTQTPDGGSDDDAGSATEECTSARKTLLGPVSSVSKGEVKVITTKNDVTEIFIDATAGGSGPTASRNPRTYIKLDGTRVDIDDNAAFTSSDWDLAFKRADIFTNGGDSGPGKGAGVRVEKAFAAVTMADADSVAQERFFNGDCEAIKDEANAVVTTFTGWYDYDDATHIPVPKPNVTFVVKSADGTLFKVGLESYQGKDDGSQGTITGDYIIQVARL